MKTIKHLFCLLAVVFIPAGARAGFSYVFQEPPPPPPTCTSPPGVGGTGGSLFSFCSTCSANLPPVTGMPDWKVNEPNIDLRIHDVPLAYQTSVGPFSFQLDYWQRDDRVPTNYVFTLGPGWECSWGGYVSNPTGDYGDPATLYAPGGGEIYFDEGTSPEPNYFYKLVLQRFTDGGGNLTGYELDYPDGAIDYYNFLASPTTGTNVLFYLSQKIDPQGHTNTFIYEPYNPATGRVQLNEVIDPDGKTNTLSYTNAGPYNELISQVQDPYGHQVHFLYDPNGYLTNVTDVAGYSSSFGYGDFAAGNDQITNDAGDLYGYVTNRWLDRLTTPYGTTRFAFTDEGLEINPSELETLMNAGQVSGLLRTVVVTEADGSHQMFAFDTRDTNLWGNVVTNQIPTSTPDGSWLDDGATLNYRNSFYWGRQQFAGLSAHFQTNGPNWDLTQLSTNDFLRGRWRRYLHTYENQGVEINGQSDTLSMEADPSPDGVNPGAMTWYTYPGQTPYGTDIYANSADPYIGTGDYPGLVLKILPDGSQWYKAFQQDPWNNITNEINTYTLSDGTLATRTNGYVYSDDGADLLQVIGPDGVTNAAYGYDASHQVIAATNALGEVTRCTYNGNEQVTGITLPTGLELTNLYNADGFVAQQIMVGLATNSFTYTNGLVLTHTDALGLTVTNGWDALERLTNVAFPDGTAISIRYDKLDVATVKDRMSFTFSYGYDPVRRMLVATNALGQVTGYAYCECGALDAITNALGNVIQFVHDNQGHVIQTIYPDGYTVNDQYNLVQQLTHRSDNTGAFWNLAYNHQGLITGVTNALGSLGSATFDLYDRPVSVTDANQVTVTNAYDALDRVLTRTWLDGVGEGYRYTPAGLMAYTNRDRQVTRYGRNAAGWLLAVTNANLEVDQLTRDAAGNVLTLLDGLNHKTQWQFNEFGWLTNKIDGRGSNVFRYAYNSDGWLTNRWTPQMGDTAYRYDGVGNLTNILYVAQASSLTFGYDTDNGLISMQDMTGLTQFKRDSMGRLLAESNAWTTVSNSYSLGLRTSLTIAQSGANWKQSYAYDTGWRLTNTASPAGGFLYEYSQPSTLISQLRLPNGATITNSYDSLARLTETDLKNHWGHTLDGYTYKVDPLGLRTNIIRNFGLAMNTVNIGYDKISQLTAWTATETNGAPRYNEQFGWKYDAADNLAIRTNNLLLQNYMVDGANELTNISRTGTYTLSGATPAPASSLLVNGQTAQTYGDFTFAQTNLVLGNGSNAFSIVGLNIYSVRSTNLTTYYLPTNNVLGYDQNGNLTNDGQKAYGWDAENQMTNITLAGAWKKDFVFDGLNRLRIKREYTWTNSAWLKTNETRFVWDVNVIVQLRDSNNVPTLTLTRGLDLSGSLQGAGGIGGLLGMSDGSGENYFYHQDGNGNVTALMDGYENIVGRREFDAFGRTINLTGSKTAINPFWFAGQFHDEALDMDFYHYRNLFHNLQRWGSKDPAGLAGGFNPYSFAYDDPANLVDKDGRIVPLLIAAFVIGAVLAEEPANAPGFNPDGTPQQGEPMLNFPQHLEAGAGSALMAGVTVGLVKGGGAVVDGWAGKTPATPLKTSCPNTGKPIVIGQNMKDRVQPFADAWGFETYRPSRWFDDPAELNAENMKWINDMMDQGRTIYNVGPDEDLSPSQALQNELSQIYQRSYPINSFEIFNGHGI